MATKIDFPNDCPEDCTYLQGTTDAFNTGDSPTQYECLARNPKACPLLRERFIKDHIEVIHVGGES